MSLSDAVADTQRRSSIAKAAVVEVAAAIRARSGLKGLAAQVGLDTINRLRPGFLEGQIDVLLPGMAEALEPWWHDGLESGDAPQWLNGHRLQVAEDLLTVTDEYVAQASDQVAIAVYDRLRKQAPVRIAHEMPRISTFIQTHAGDSLPD